MVRGAGESLKFQHFEDFVHIDDKWFYVLKDWSAVTVCSTTTPLSAGNSRDTGPIAQLLVLFRT